MWTKKAILYTGAGALSILFSISFSSFQLMFFGITVLSMLLMSSFGAKGVKLELKRVMSNDKIFEENEIEVDLEAENKGRNTGLIEIRDKIPRQVKLVEGNNYNFVRMKKGEKVTLKYKMLCPLTGLYPVGPLNLRFSDPFSIFFETVNIDNVDSISIYPKIDYLKDMSLTSTSIRMYPGALSIRNPGAGSQFYSIRDYVPGDVFKDINWKAFARCGRLVVNEHQKDVVSDVTIIVDSRECSAVGIEEFSPIKYSVRAAATLTDTFLGRRDSVSLIVYSDEVKHIKPGGGDKQLYQILTNLAGAVPKGNLPLASVLEITMPYLPPRTPIVLMSSLYKDESVVEAIRHVRALGHEVIVFSPNQVEFVEHGIKIRKERAKKKLSKDKTDDKINDKSHEKKNLDENDDSAEKEEINMAYEILKIERDVLIAEIRGYGARVVDWSPDESFMTVLMEAITSG